jgi:Multicopper oxidase
LPEVRFVLVNLLENTEWNACKSALFRRSRKPLSVIRRVVGSNPTPSASSASAATPTLTRRYMFHCHILQHEDRGVMGQFVVYEPGDEAAALAHARARESD